jgi:hypothetical protein
MNSYGSLYPTGSDITAEQITNINKSILK